MNKKNSNKILIAAAWPYANGSLHLGHASALIGADILARYYRLKGDDVLFVSGSDCHGTPIAVEAEKLGISPADISSKYHKEFRETLIDGLGFSYDNYTTTTTKNHTEVVQKVFKKLYDEGNIYTKTEELSFCEKDQRFLPDRYVEGQCPICKFDNARGDQCDNCGNLLDPKQLISPRCKLCGSAPIWKPSEHFYLKLSAFETKLKKFIANSEGWRENAKAFSFNFMSEGLHDRAITRDTDWGVEIPLPGYETKRIYVWFEAVCGYLSASVEWAKNQGEEDKWQDFWENKKALHYYVHGKDNIPFHTTIWPAILMAYGGLHLPDRIISSEYLTLERKQFSKSRKWAVWLPEFLSSFDGDVLRYYLTANGPETGDADFSWKELQVKNNKELIGNIGNFINRVLTFIKNNFPDGIDLKKAEAQNEFIATAKEMFDKVGGDIEAGNFKDALKSISALVDFGNKYINEQAPWEKLKNGGDATTSLAVSVQVIRGLSILVEPFLPKTSAKLKTTIGLADNAKWEFPAEYDGLFIPNNPAPLFRRIEDEEIKAQEEKLGK